MSRDLTVVERHLAHWRDAGLITDEQRRELWASSEKLARSGVNSVLRTALALLGGALVLAGLMLVIAENWDAMHRMVKLGGWAVLLGGFLFAAHHLGHRLPHRPALAEAFALLAGGWVLAGIALVSQIYHLDSRPPNGIWLWLALVLPAAWLLERRATAAVVFTALVAGLTLEIQEPRSIVYATRMASPWLWLAIPLLAGFLVSLLPRPWPSLRGWLGLWILGISQVFLLVLGAFQELDHSGLGRGWILAAAGLGAALAVPGRVLPEAWDGLTSRILLAATLLPWALVGARYERAVILDNVGLGAAWVVQIALALLIIRAGAKSGAAVWVNLGYVALLAGIVVRYFDFFGDFLEGGLALTLTGALLLFVLYALERARRRTFDTEAA